MFFSINNFWVTSEKDVMNIIVTQSKSYFFSCTYVLIIQYAHTYFITFLHFIF